MPIQQKPIFSNNFGHHNSIQHLLDKRDLKLALNFVKNKFPKTSLRKSILSLNDYYQRHFYNYYQMQSLQNNRDKLRLDEINFDTHNHNQHRSITVLNKQSAQKKMIQLQNKKLIARLFCQQGMNMAAVKKFIPDITPQLYRSNLNSIVNKIIKDLLTMLKVQCQVEVKRLTETQKILVRSALRQAHTWMPSKNLKAFQTFLKMMSKRYIKRVVVITNEELKGLYSAIARRINDKNLDIQDVKPKNYFGEDYQQRNRSDFPNNKSQFGATMISVDQQRICEAYVLCLDIQKTIQNLIGKYGFSWKWDILTIERIVINKIEQSLQKIAKLYNKTNPSDKGLGINSQTAKSIYECQQNYLKTTLLQLNEVKKMKSAEFAFLITKIKDFLKITVQNFPQMTDDNQINNADIADLENSQTFSCSSQGINDFSKEQDFQMQSMEEQLNQFGQPIQSHFDNTKPVIE